MAEYSEIFDRRGDDYNRAVAMYPQARETERGELIAWLQPRAHERIADAPAGGGYLADGIRARIEGSIDIICIEPSERFAEAIANEYRVINKPLENVNSLADQTLDAIASLAGLHHFREKHLVYREWHRLLKAGGRVVLADVEVDTGTARFLNIFVHEYTPGGHEGLFLTPGELTEELTAEGYTNIQESLVTVPWYFPDMEAMLAFCQNLFAIEKADSNILHKALDEYLGFYQADDGGIMLNWQLRYAMAERQ